MLSLSRTLFLICSILSHLRGIRAWDEVRCLDYGSTPGQRKDWAKDCDSALDLIPYGLWFDPGHPGDRGRAEKVFDLHPGYPWRKRTQISLPAAFRSGACVILVERQPSPIVLGGPRPPKQGATAMYFYVWPRVRERVGAILKRCALHAAENMGTTRTWIRLGDWYARFRISVRPTPEQMVRHGELQMIAPWWIAYTVYDDGGGASDQAGPGQVASSVESSPDS